MARYLLTHGVVKIGTAKYFADKHGAPVEIELSEKQAEGLLREGILKPTAPVAASPSTKQSFGDKK